MDMPTRAENNTNTNYLIEANVPTLVSRICVCWCSMTNAVVNNVHQVYSTRDCLKSSADHIFYNQIMHKRINTCSAIHPVALENWERVHML